MAKKPKRAAIYARVSTRNGQTPQNQILRLREVADKAGWVVVEEFVDRGVSGAKGRDKRPAFDRLCKAATRREIDVVMAWSVDRLGRSLQGLVAFLSDLQASRVDLYLDRQGIDTTTPAGKALFQMMGVFAEFERAMIQERVHAGLARARKEGKRLGWYRPILRTCRSGAGPSTWCSATACSSIRRTRNKPWIIFWSLLGTTDTSSFTPMREISSRCSVGNMRFARLRPE